MAFRGFPPSAITFFEGLEADNSKAYWTANKATYEEAVKGPMEELIASLDGRFQPMRIFRPYRDVRFSKDKAPYKTNIAAAGETEGGATHYISLSTRGLVAGTGYYAMASDQLARFREAVDRDAAGEECAEIVRRMNKDGYGIGAYDELKGAPRGFAKDHPRIDLIRRKGLMVWKEWPPAKWFGTTKARDRVIETWVGADELNAWLDAHVGPSELPPEDRPHR
jgi:uncharacterized protein (TIGR02453 family)